MKITHAIVKEVSENFSSVSPTPPLENLILPAPVSNMPTTFKRLKTAEFK